MTPGNEMIPATTRRMARAAAQTAQSVESTKAAQTPKRRATVPWSRRRGVMTAFGAFAALGFAAAYVGPVGAALAETDHPAADASASLYASAVQGAQSLDLVDLGTGPIVLERGSYTVYVAPKPTPPPAAAAPKKAGGGAAFTPPFVVPDPGTAKAVAYDMVTARGWGDAEYACLVALWQRESGWRVNAANGSGAYGIPQALPGSKMAAYGADWQTNPATQIAWGLGYIQGRYGTPCGAWSHSQSTGWY